MTHETQPRPPTRRRFLQLSAATAAALGVGVATTGTAAANPNFPGRIFADDRLFATKGVATLPEPTGNNHHSFDELYVFVGDAAEGQYAVAEAAPGEQDYNGGRWSVTQVEWTGDPILLTDDDALREQVLLGNLAIVDTGVQYFECPLVPV